MELCYRNNPNSLFRKYARLVSWFARTGIGRDYLGVPRDISLMLPNGYHQTDDGRNVRATFYSRAVFAPKLYPALARLDTVQQWLKDFKEAKQLLAWELGLTRNMPALAKAVMLAQATFNPNADPESTSVDGIAGRKPAAAEVWATIRAGAGDFSADAVVKGDSAVQQSLGEVCSNTT